MVLDKQVLNPSLVTTVQTAWVVTATSGRGRELYARTIGVAYEDDVLSNI